MQKHTDDMFVLVLFVPIFFTMIVIFINCFLSELNENLYALSLFTHIDPT